MVSITQFAQNVCNRVSSNILLAYPASSLSTHFNLAAVVVLSPSQQPTVAIVAFPSYYPSQITGKQKAKVKTKFIEIKTNTKIIKKIIPVTGGTANTKKSMAPKKTMAKLKTKYVVNRKVKEQ